MSVSVSPALTPVTLSDALIPARANPLLRDALLVVGTSVLVAVFAQIAIPLPGNPVPITLQSFGVVLAGILLGRKRGAAALALYLAEGASGLPVFAQGKFGPLMFVGPTGGYLLAFPIAAFVVGWLAERGWDRKPITAAAAMAIGLLLILTIGTLALEHLVGSMSSAFALGFAPFVIGETAKTIVAAGLLPTAWRFLENDPSNR